jgi:hypothetical protein
MLWLKKGFDFAGEWTVRRQNELLACCFGLLVADGGRYLRGATALAGVGDDAIFLCVSQ